MTLLDRRFAEWRVDSAEPYSPQAEYLRRLRGLTPWQKLTPLCFVGIVVFSVIIKPTLFLYLAYTQIARKWGAYFEPNEQADPEMVGLMDDPSPYSQYPVDLVVCRDDTIIGEDRGIVTFVEGWLNYDGLACSFSLSRLDLVRIEDGREIPSERLSRVVPGLYPYRLVCAGEPKIVAAFRMRTSLTGREGLLGCLGTRLTQWRLQDVAIGISVLPPKTPHPNAWYRPWLERTSMVARAGLVSACLLGAVLKLYLTPGSANDLESAPIAILLTGCVAIVSGGLFIAAWRRMRRTEDRLSAWKGESDEAEPSLVPAPGQSTVWRIESSA